jgi:hypothetical protein
VSLIDDTAATELAGLTGPPAYSPRQLLDIASIVAASSRSVLEPGPLVTRRYELLELTDDLEVWMIHWPAGGRLALHDHGGSNGALWVQRGQLREHAVTGGRSLVRHRLPAGSGRAFGGTDIHDVVNAGRRPAASVHAYSPPMPSMTFYRLGRTGLSVERTDYRCDPTWAP